MDKEKAFKKMDDLMGVQGNAGEAILGKLLYFSLSKILIRKDDLEAICTSMDLPVSYKKRTSPVDAFKSATGDIYSRETEKGPDGSLSVYKIYCRDNQKTGNIYSRELVREKLGATTNQYTKLANLSYDADTGLFNYTISPVNYMSAIEDFCINAEKMFYLYQECAGRSQLETLTENFLDQMDCLGIDIHGRLYFIPKDKLPMLGLFEDFIDMLGKHNMRDGSVTVNSMFVADDQKQRDKISIEFYNMARKDIELYTQKIEHLITTGSNSPAVMLRWIAKVDAFKQKKRYYEELFQQELDQMGAGYEMLEALTMELRLQANRLPKAA